MNAFEATPFVVLLDASGAAVWASRGESGVPRDALIGTTIWDWAIAADRRLAQRAFADCLLFREAQRFTVSVDARGQVVQQCVTLEHTGGNLRPVIVKSHALDARLFSLTLRQKDVLRCLSLGYSRKQTARELGVKPVTIDAHCATLCDRLELSGSIELTVWAMFHSHDL